MHKVPHSLVEMKRGPTRMLVFLNVILTSVTEQGECKHTRYQKHNNLLWKTIKKKEKEKENGVKDRDLAEMSRFR